MMKIINNTRIKIIFILILIFLMSVTVYAQTDTLSSNFFKDDSITQKILSGERYYSMGDYGLICGINPGKSDQYGFKILNAIKQLGYFNGQKCNEAGDKTALLILNEFQRKNILPESDYVDKNTILKLDSQIREVEARDNAVATQFICYKYLKAAPQNDASKNHLAFLYMLAMNAYPENLRIKEAECLNRQTFFVSHGQEKGQEQVLCDPGYWKGYDDYCNTRGVFEVWNTQSKDDFSLVNAVIHEHAHFIDDNLNHLGENKIDTTSFYNISYNSSDKVEDGWTFYKPRVNMTDVDQKKEHFFSYAEGWTSNNYPGYYTASEDFAVSMEMYIMHGVVFRDYMKDKPILAKKYNWIKKNVFNEAEFNTGDPDYASYAPNLYNIGRGIVAAGGIAELRPDYIWDYKIVLATTSHPVTANFKDATTSLYLIIGIAILLVIFFVIFLLKRKKK